MIRSSLALALLFCSAVHATPPPTITVGGMTLDYCNKEYTGYCGSITQPLDRSGRYPGTVDVGFEFYQHTDMSQPSLGVIMAQEGGPGYSTTGSRDGYVRLFTPLRDRRDIILIDKRGTGLSSPIDCPALQKAYNPSVGDVGECAKQLGASGWFYRSADAAMDVAAVISALQLSPVDYYGDSYGTWFGQVLSVLYPSLLRTIVLDSAYPVVNDNSNSEVNNGRVAMNLVCARSSPCAVLGRDAKKRFEALLTGLRAAPVNGVAPGAKGEPRKVTADAEGMFLVIANAGNSPTTWRDLDAAARAWLDNQDSLPLLRLIAEARDSYSGGGSYKEFSVGLADAVQCAEYGMNFDLHDTVGERYRQYRASLAALEADHPGIFAPFTVEEAVHSQMNAEEYNTCLRWSVPARGVQPHHPIPAGSVFPSVPVLVLSGELDTVTSPSEGAATAALFPDATYIKTTNLVHESAIGDAGFFVPPDGEDLAQCIGPIVRHFVLSGGSTGDTSCLAGIRPIRTVPAFATSYTSVAPAEALPGNQVDAIGLQLAAAATATVGDALARYYITPSGSDVGLRGGSFTLHATKVGYDLRLTDMQWTTDVIVSGALNWNQMTGDIASHITFTAAGHTGAMQLNWNDRQTEAIAQLTGTVDGQTLVAQQLAP
jgi:pimeloyl-ACP methyl ester carboxylesterase